MLVIMLAFVRCSSEEDVATEQPVARVGDKNLYPSDLKKFTRNPWQDSTTAVKAYINSWIKEQLLLRKAEANLSEQQKDKNKQLEEYRNSLIIYEYEKELIRQRLDTSVSREEIINYYNENKSNFELKKNLIRLHYAKLPKEAPDIENAKKWFKSTNEEDFQALVEYCNNYAANSFFDDKVWLSFDQVTKEIPIKTYDEEQFLENNKYLDLFDESFIYLVNIKGFRVKNSISALEYEVENIRRIIINKRKVKLLMEMEDKVMEDAAINNTFEIYTP